MSSVKELVNIVNPECPVLFLFRTSEAGQQFHVQSVYEIWHHFSVDSICLRGLLRGVKCLMLGLSRREHRRKKPDQEAEAEEWDLLWFGVGLKHMGV